MFVKRIIMHHIMKYIFSGNTNSGLNHIWLLFFRVVLAAFMLTHGWGKLNMLLSGNGAEFSDPLGIGANLSLVLAVLGEVVGPVLIMLGLGTRIAAILPIATMAVAAFIVLGSTPFQKKEMALLYMVGFITILVLGAGRYSLDALISRKKESR